MVDSRSRPAFAGGGKQIGERSQGNRQRYPTVEALLRFGAVPAAVVYGLLFLAYRSYYAGLGVDPEDVGIDNSYILSRSAGFIFLVALFAFFVVLSQWADHALTDKISEPAIALVKTTFVIPFGLFLVALLVPGVPKIVFVFTVLLACAAQVAPISLFRKFGPWASTVAYALILLIGVSVTAFALISRASYSSTQANSGCEVAPIEFVSLPVLDFSAPPVVATWIGPQSQRPAIFGSESSPRDLLGLLVGRGDGGDFILLNPGPKPALVRIPTALMVTRIGLSHSVSACEVE